MQQIFKKCIVLILGMYFVSCKLTDSSNDVSKAKQFQKDASFPGKIGQINDFAKVFTTAEKQHLDSVCTAILNQSKLEFVIVSLSDSSLNQHSLFTYTLNLANYWGIGKTTEKGILIGFNLPTKGIRIQNSYEVEKKLSDTATKRILQAYIIPEFKTENYAAGIENGMLAMQKYIDNRK